VTSASAGRREAPPAGDGADGRGAAGGRVPRRALLISAGGLAAGAAGAGITLAATSGGTAASRPPGTAAGLVTPTEDLMQEHGLLLRVLLAYREVLGRLSAGRPVPAGQLHDAAVVIHDYIEGFHEPLEEGYIFPRLKRGPLAETVSTLLLQHARGREQTQLILAATAAHPAAGTDRARLGESLAAFVRMYEPHEAREDTVIYPAFRQAAGPAEITALSQHFSALEREQFGPAGFTEMLGKVAAVEQALGIYDLAQFTPPNITPPG
jgi:hemerythrin-like domain-containing protein